MKLIKNREIEKERQKDLNQKMMMFDKIPDHCVACEKMFDKTNKEMVQTWTVVVRDKEGIVNLYCPPCIEQAKTIIKDFQERLKNKTLDEK